MTEPSTHAYRPDVDGLRAVAVLAVLAFHAFPHRLPGGFTGVDIFFVISGYLITGILLKSFREGSFSLLEFYGRRARRLFPALFLVLGACLALGWHVLLPKDFSTLGLHAAAGAGFVANFVFWSESGYFEQASELKILLHLWSLAIEEQFYLVWPLLLLAVVRAKQRVGWFVALVAVATFAFGVFFTREDPVGAFFHPASRAWELAIGGGIAVGFGWISRSLSRPVLHALSVFGAVFVAVSVVSLNRDMPFPGMLALLPTLGAACLVVAGPAGIVNRWVLSNPVMVGVGLISYPLYLWHWPILAFLRTVGGVEPSSMVKLTALGVAGVLAGFTYLFVERPLRHGSYLGAKAVSLVALVAVVGLSALWIHRSEGLPTRPSIAAYLDISQSLDRWTKWDFAENDTCLKRYPSADRRPGWWFCVTNRDAPPTLLLLGNSYANHLYPGVAQHPAFAGHTVLQFGSCDPAMGIRYEAYIPSHPCYGEKRQRQEQLVNDLIRARSSVQVALLSAPWPRFDDAGRAVMYRDPDTEDGPYTDLEPREGDTSYSVFMRGIERRVAFLIDHGVTPIVVFGTPQLGYSPSLCYTSQPYRAGEKSCVVPRTQEEELQRRFRAGIREIQARYPQLMTFDPLPALCGGGDCNLKEVQGPLVRDIGHLSLAGSLRVGEALAAWARANYPQMLRPD